MGGAKNHLIAMPDCDEVGLQEYRNKGLEKSVGFVLKYVKHSWPLPFSGFHDFLHHPAQQDMTISDIMNSAFGSAGQRCMAASILIIVGKGQSEPWKVENWESTCGWMESWEWFLGSLNNHEAPLIRPCFPRGDLCIGRGGPLEFPWMAFGSCFSLHLGSKLCLGRKAFLEKLVAKAASLKATWQRFD